MAIFFNFTSLQVLQEKSRYLSIRGIKLETKKQIAAPTPQQRAGNVTSYPPSAFARHLVRSRRPGPRPIPFRAFQPLVRRQHRISEKRMAGLQASNPAVCHMTRRGVSAMVPSQYDPSLVPIGVL
jgi:hypothetical protein